MKFSEQWLREWVSPALTTEELIEQLTMAGLEVDGVEPVAAGFTGVVVAKIESIAQHPDADKLRVCQVNDGSAVHQVVCGASNARENLIIPFARVGAALSEDFVIKKAKLRGVESFGMLCGASELGMEDLVDGLMELPEDAPLGVCLIEYLKLNDKVIEVDLTPNRADCLSIQGIAREVGLLNSIDVNSFKIKEIGEKSNKSLKVCLQDTDGCPRYVSRVIEGVNLSASTPLWMQEKLRRSDIRSIDPIVDVTNFVLLELGQPMHAFDLAKLAGGITVRGAAKEEKLVLLDGQEITLIEGDLVIADDQKALALAGIMGGKDSGVSKQTQDIVLEAAYFAPELIAGRARSYKLHTDSSHRFERGVDPELQQKAMARATELILQIAGGDAGPVIEAKSDSQSFSHQPIVLREARIKGLLGFSLPAETVEEILVRLGCKVEKNQQGWMVSAPSWRFDLTLEVDLLEELARVYGYNHFPTNKIFSAIEIHTGKEEITSVDTLKLQLVSRGYQEVITYSFIDAQQEALFGFSDGVQLQNPISHEMGIMRQSLWPGLVKTALYNLNRQQASVRIFESGLRFVKEVGSELKQELVMAGLITGKQFTERWSNDSREVDFFDLKGDVEALLSKQLSDQWEFKAATHPALHPGQTAQILSAGEVIGLIGVLHPSVSQTVGMVGKTVLFELSLDKLTKGKLPHFKELSKFPEVRRDLAVIVDETILVADLQAAIKKEAGEHLTRTLTFDVYQGSGVEAGKKSVAVGMVWQHPSRTLNEGEINEVVTNIIQKLQHSFNASLRD